MENITATEGGKPQIRHEPPETLLAFRRSVPVMIGVIPFGITCGLMGMTAGLTGLETILMSILVFAGASQFIGITMISTGVTGWGIIVFTTLLVNLRHILMGVSLAPHMVKLPFRHQAGLSFLLTDESYALTVSRIKEKEYSTGFQKITGLSLYLTWILSTLTGVVLGSYIPDPLAWGLDFAMPLTFLVLLMPMLADKTSIAVAVISAITTVITSVYLPGKWYIIAACLTASIAGGLLERRKTHAD